jgi:hypothetical protein
MDLDQIDPGVDGTKRTSAVKIVIGHERVVVPESWIIGPEEVTFSSSCDQMEWVAMDFRERNVRRKVEPYSFRTKSD